MTNSEEDRAIIQNHAHLYKQIMALLVMESGGHRYVRRDRVLGLLHLTEEDKQFPRLRIED